MTLVTCHTGPPGVGASLKHYNADWSLFIRAESQSWLCSAPLPVCSGLSVIKRSEDFLAKIFLQRKHAGSKSRGRFWKFNQIWSPPLSLWRPSLLPPLIVLLGSRDQGFISAWPELGEWIETVRSFGGPMTLLSRAVKRFEPNCDKLVWNTITKYFSEIWTSLPSVNNKNRVNYIEH